MNAAIPTSVEGMRLRLAPGLVAAALTLPVLGCGGQRAQAVRLGDWKGVRLDLIADPGAPIELYDLHSDFGEAENVADRHPDTVREIVRIMSSARTDSRIWPTLNEPVRLGSRLRTAVADRMLQSEETRDHATGRNPVPTPSEGLDRTSRR